MGNCLAPSSAALYPIVLKRCPRKIHRIVELVPHELAAVVSNDKFVRIFSLSTGKMVKRICAHSKYTKDIAIVDSNFFLTVGSDFTARLWEIHQWRCVAVQRLPDWGVSCAGIGDGHMVIGTGITGRLIEIVAKNRRLTILRNIRAGGATFDQINVHGKIIITTQLLGKVRVWDMNSFRCVATICDKKSYSAVTAAMNSQHLITGTTDNYIRCHDSITYKEIWTVRRDAGSPKCFQFTGDGKNILCGTTKELLLLDTHTGNLKWKLNWDGCFSSIKSVSKDRIIAGTVGSGAAVFELNQLLRMVNQT